MAPNCNRSSGRGRETVMAVLAVVAVALTVPAVAVANKRQLRAAEDSFNKRWNPVKSTFEALVASTNVNIALCNVAAQEPDPAAQSAEWAQVKIVAGQTEASWDALRAGNWKQLADRAGAVKKAIDGQFTPPERVFVAKASGLLEGAAGLAFDGTYFGSRANEAVAAQDCSSGLDRNVKAGDALGVALGRKSRASHLIHAAL